MGNNPSGFSGDKRPVETVSWDDCVEFCQKLAQKLGKDMSLPSEAQWEYACRAGTTTPFYFGETITGDLANYTATEVYANEPKGQDRVETTEIGRFPPNAFGLYDMHGNVSEWCLDQWHESYNGAPTDGSAWIDNDNDSQIDRILRGGSWINYPSRCRCAARERFFPVLSMFVIGFRLVLGGEDSL
jgi:formylglycine-generating enzyme required for sulfatase activity